MLWVSLARKRNCITLAVLAMLCAYGLASAETPFAATVVEFAPAPGQLVNNPAFNDPARALGAPSGGGTLSPDNSSVVSLGGFGGSITLAFDHTVLDDPANPFGMDAVVFGNAFWVGVAGDANRHWAECGVIEIARDTDNNGMVDEDETWYVISGSHIVDLDAQFIEQTWDDDWQDSAFPPANPGWIPPGEIGVWQTAGFKLPPEIFGVQVVVNPAGPNAVVEGAFGYADYSPTLVLGDTNGDNIVDAPQQTAEEFYTFPDDPFAVGMTLGSGGGDALDIAWAVDPLTGMPADLDGFDFVRISTGSNVLLGAFGELSTEIDAVSDVSPGLMGDADADGDIDLWDLAFLIDCTTGPEVAIGDPVCRIFDFDFDNDVDLIDFSVMQIVFTGEGG